MRTIDKSELKHIMDNEPNALIINVLPKENYEKQHIPNSINIPVKNNDRFAEEVGIRAKSKNQKIVVYCANTDCNLSEKAQKKLEDADFTNVADYEAGTAGWFNQDKQAA